MIIAKIVPDDILWFFVCAKIEIFEKKDNRKLKKDRISINPNLIIQKSKNLIFYFVTFAKWNSHQNF